MKNFHATLLIGALLAVACNYSSKKTTEVATGEDTSKQLENKIMIPTSACYTSISGKDTFRLKVEVFPNVVTGKISYQFFDKDSNNGELKGTLHGDTLLADYQFRSEGKLSSRQVIFLIKDNVATEGFGEMEEKDGKMVFKNINMVNFEKGIKFLKSDCGEY